ncbi:MAG: type I restriction endonuclease [Sedimenticola sp.]
MKYNEDTRVKIPTILHLTRLGYEYLSLKDAKWDEATNIFPEIFKKGIAKVNPGIEDHEVTRLLEDATLSLGNEDLGKAFYEILTEQSGHKLIDFSDFNNNLFHVVTELTYKNGDDEFRPDIILLINGMPLAFIEVKKPNNREGVLAEKKRINTRSQNPKFRQFVNITQLMVFSNNMEYDDNSPEPIEGAFYASSSYERPIFNYFREEETGLEQQLRSEDDAVEDQVLLDNNLISIKHSPEFATNKSPDRPTNRICTSLFSRDRLSFILRYAIAYVNESDGLQKHIMRYPQLFATKAIVSKLSEGFRKGIIWHTQGSGKTALAYYNVRHLTDYFQKQSVIPKFYFIVDRLDLLTQAHREFTSRGLVVHTINSRDDFAKDIKSRGVIHNHSGKPEITVVNIQKFKDDPDVVSTDDYDVNIQRIYFLDEVHRSYNPKGSFLANLSQSDSNAIKIGLTGTPLLGDDFNSKTLFGDYIHKYYYNASIADGYTLRLIREEIETHYKLQLQKALDELEVEQGDLDKKLIFAHHRYVEPMLDYIVTDFENSRTAFDDSSIGGMVICDSADQAKKMFEIFETKYANSQPVALPMAAEPPPPSYGEKKHQDNKVKTAALILHDIGTKDERKEKVEDFKEGKIDFLFVFNMLLTGFDAKRLKKLYLGRVIKRHNLLQALTRVNRTYKEFRYGYVVDFADIRKEFDATNKAYFDELQAELGDEMEHYSNLFKSAEEIQEEIEQLKDLLFQFDIDNAEIFSQQISEMQDREKVQALKKALGDAKSLYNLIRLFGHYDLLEKIDFKKLNILYREVSNHLDLLNLKDKVENSSDNSNLLNTALEDVLFMFTKVKEEELILADKLKSALRRTREALAGNFDPKDPEFVTLKEELERLFKKKNLSEVTQEEMNRNIEVLNELHGRAKELNRQNDLLKAKYQNDTKYARLHKRLMEGEAFPGQERRIFEALQSVKQQADDSVLNNSQILQNEAYFEKTTLPMVVRNFKGEQKMNLTPDLSRTINGLLVQEYMNEHNGVNPW